MDKRVEEFWAKYYKLLRQDKFISRKEMDLFIDEFISVFDEDTLNNMSNSMRFDIKKISNSINKVLKNRNNRYIEESMYNYKLYFDTLFRGIDNDVLLDNNQREAIVNNEDYNIIVAGAGAGKTTTMAAKAKFLVDIKKVDPSEILVISYTNKAVDEIAKRINEDFDTPIKVTTFHSLGMDIIKEGSGKSYRAINEGEQYKIITNILSREILLDNDLLSDTLKFLSEYINFDKDILKFKNLEEYHEYKVNLNYQTFKDNIKDYNEKIIKNRTEYYRTVQSEYVRSMEEVNIANFLFMNNIAYTYEKRYPYKTRGVYKPDFYIEQGELTAYIEHFGISQAGHNSSFSEYELNKYKRNIIQKRKAHHGYGTTLIESFSRFNDKRPYLEHLKENLEKQGFLLKPLSNKDIYKKLMDTSRDKYIYRLTRMLMDFIKMRTSGVVNDKSYFEIKELEQEPRIQMFCKIYEDVYKKYKEKLEVDRLIDFDEMISKALKIMEDDEIILHNLNYSHIIVDEYQDISPIRFNLLKDFANKMNSKITAVGDDWQSIFGFAGSNVKLFTDFQKLMGYGDQIMITNTYRNSQELINVAGEFIEKNEEQIKKNLKSFKHLYKPIEVFSYRNDRENSLNKALTIENIISGIYKEHPDHNILLIGRYNFDIDNLIDTPLFRQLSNDPNIIICEKYPKAKVEFLTAHKAKGLGFDQVIIINAIDGRYGFPSNISDDPIFEKFKKSESKNIMHAEERRLFYVAITRTKNKVFIIAPSNKPSPFVIELKDNLNVHFNDALIELYETYKKNMKCPVCGYPLEETYELDIGKIYRCTNDKEICDFRTSNVERKVPIKNCPSCKTGYLMDKGLSRNGKIIYGCTNYTDGICDYKEFL